MVFTHMDSGASLVAINAAVTKEVPIVGDGRYSQLAASKNVFTGKAEYNGGFTNAYDTDLWIAGSVRTNPTVNSQGEYIQHRVSGDLGGMVHDACASELRITSGTNSGSGENAHESSLVITGGANTLTSLNASVSNFHVENSPTGTITSLALYRAQTVPGLVGGISVSSIYGIYLEPQTRGTVENWSCYAPGAPSLFGATILDSPTPSASRYVGFTTNKVSRWMIRANGNAETGGNAGSDLEISARSDAGGSNFTPLVITRSSGLVSINNGLKISGNLGFFNTNPIAQPVLATGASHTVDDVITTLQSFGLVKQS